MSGTYTVPIPETAVSEARDLLEIVGHANRPFVLIGFKLVQKTEVGEAHEEVLHLAWKSGQTTSGSGGPGAAAPHNNDVGGGAPGFTGEVLNTTKASAGTILTHHNWGFQVRGGEIERLIPEEFRHLLAAGRRATLELVNAPGDAITIAGEATIVEYGS